LSSGYSHSPALHLPLTEPGFPPGLSYLLGAAIGLALLALLQRGQFAAALAAAAVAPPAWRALRGAGRDVAGQLCWRAGRWRLRQAGGECELQPQAGLVACGRWVWLCFRRERDGDRVTLWLYRRGMDAQQWRRLRVRLRLDLAR